MRRSLVAFALGCSLSLQLQPAGAEEPTAAGLQLPAGSLPLSQRETALGTYALPVGPFGPTGIAQRLTEGHILRRTWQLRGDATALQVLEPLRRQLVVQGYEIEFQCAARQCGGFDFRFGIEVVPAPDMVVSLSDYYFLAAIGPEGSGAQDGVPAVVSLLVSRSGTANYVQLIEVSPDRQPPLELVAPDTPPAQVVAVSLGDQLLQQGHAVLKGLEFNTGDAEVGPEASAILKDFAAFLEAEPTARILIVGHTDTVGTLADNISLSQRRASRIKEALIQTHDIDGDRVEVAGAGYMAPIASNLTAAGRQTNRRVEVVLVTE